MPDYPHQLPDAIAKRLEEFRKKLWWMKAAEAALAGGFGLLAAFLLVFALDRFIDTPVWLRVLLLVGGSSLLAFFAPHWLHRWLWKHRRADQLAKLVRRSHPRFGDRLLGAVELASQDATQTALSPVLREAALRQIAAETERRGTLEDALPPSRHRRWGIIVAALAVAVVIGFVVTPEAGVNALRRWANPLGDTPRYTFTQLKPLPERLVVAQGEPFDVELRLTDASKQIPDSASVRVGADMPFSIRRDGRHYTFRFNGLLNPQTLRFEVGDARPEIQVAPLPRPGITSIHGQLLYPQYLGIPAEKLNLSDGLVNVVEGASLLLQGSATRPLARVAISALEGPENDLPKIKLSGADFQADAAISALPLPPPPEGATPDSLPEATRRVALHFTDQDGLAAKTPFVVMMRSIPDSPPNIYIEGIGREMAILDDETLEFRVIAGDDFGVKRLGLEWTTHKDGRPPGPDDAPTGETVLGEGTSQTRRLEAPGVFAPKSLQLGPQTLRLRSWSEDFKPGRPRTYSEPVNVVIMDRSQHAEMLRRRFGQLMDGLEELSRREETDHEENKRLENLKAEEMREGKNKERLQAQAEAEKRNKEAMEKLSEEAKELFRDALRNKDMESGTMKDWSEMLQKLGELSEKDMPKVEDLLRQSADPDNNSAAQQDKKMSEAIQEQKEVLEKMREAMRKANRVEQNMEAGTFVNRLRGAARTTKAIAGSLKENALRNLTKDAPTRTLGLDAEALEKEDFADILDAAKRQDKTRIELTDLQEDFGHFFRRTSKPVYEEIRKEMDEARTSDAYDMMARQTRQNWLGRTTPELLLWSDKLNAWADKLAPRKPAAGGGGSGAGGGSQGNDPGDVELMLRLLRFVQQTQDIQGQTRRVDRAKSETAPPAPAPTPRRPAVLPDPNPL